MGRDKQEPAFPEEYCLAQELLQWHGWPVCSPQTKSLPIPAPTQRHLVKADVFHVYQRAQLATCSNAGQRICRCFADTDQDFLSHIGVLDPVQGTHTTSGHLL